MPVPNASRRVLVAAYLVFVAANLIHNRWGLDPAVIPSGVFVGLTLWRRARVFAALAAVTIALPSFGFLRLNALYAPTDLWRFLNHLCLLGAGALALASAVLAFRGLREQADA